MYTQRKNVHKIFLGRRSGILLHPTSLSFAPENGSFCEQAFRFIDFLDESGFSVWQMLPINSTDQFGSPYQGTSVHAGNSNLIDLKYLVNKNWLDESCVRNRAEATGSNIDLISEARKGFTNIASDSERLCFQSFKEDHAYWLGNYALFTVIKQCQANKPWWDWSAGLSDRGSSALREINLNYREKLEDYRFEQYVFFSQWQKIRKYANEKGILLFGDMPIFTSHDSVSIWAKREYFQLNDMGMPTVVAGVPPDYFSATGQRWGNPLYDWNSLAADGFQWWINRLRTQLEIFDLIRIDHFRGLEALWEIPAHCETAEEGEWRPVPGRELLHTLENEFGDLPLVAEDLGTISEDVIKLRHEFNLPGMKVLLFAFDSDAKNPYLPHNHEAHYVVYTGTHDNNTSLGWFYNLDDKQQERVLEYLGYPNEAMPWPLIYTALRSTCQTAIIPMQDILALDESHRMNTPGTKEGNWSWRFDWSWLSSDLTMKLKHINHLYDRC